MPFHPSARLSRAQFERLLEPVLRQAAALAMSILRNRADAEDAVQEAALRGLQRIETFDASRPFRGWWLAIVRNCCLDVLRRRGRREPASMIDPDQVSDRSVAPESWRELADAMDRLSSQHREILRLRYFGGCSYHEMAQALGIPEGTVMSRLHYARKALGEQYNEET